MDTLAKLGTMRCEMCGEEHECFDVGSAGFPEPRCAACYADAVGHGAQYSDPSDAVMNVELAIGRDLTPEEAALIAAYY